MARLQASILENLIAMKPESIEHFLRMANRRREFKRRVEEAHDKVTSSGLEIVEEHGSMTHREFGEVFYRDTSMWRKRVSTARWLPNSPESFHEATISSDNLTRRSPRRTVSPPRAVATRVNLRVKKLSADVSSHRITRTGFSEGTMQRSTA